MKFTVTIAIELVIEVFDDTVSQRSIECARSLKALGLHELPEWADVMKVSVTSIKPESQFAYKPERFI